MIDIYYELFEINIFRIETLNKNEEKKFFLFIYIYKLIIIYYKIVINY